MDLKYAKHEDFKKYWVEEAGGIGPAANLRDGRYSFEEEANYLKWHLKLNTEDRVLDVGCGNGHTIKHLSVFVKEIVGIDISPRMLSAAKEVLKYTPGAWSINEGAVDIFTEPIPCEDESFDKIYCVGVLQYAFSLKEAKFAINEMYRVCKSGGKILIGDMFDATFLPSMPGAMSFFPADLELDYNAFHVPSNFEPFRRYDLFIEKP